MIDQAIADLKKAVALAPDFPDAWNTLGIAHGMKGSCGPAMMEFDRAIALKPDFAEAYVNRGLAYLNCSGNSGRAIEDFTKAITLDPGLAKAHLLRGIVLRMKGSFDEAIADLTRAIQFARQCAISSVFSAVLRAERILYFILVLVCTYNSKAVPVCCS